MTELYKFYTAIVLILLMISLSNCNNNRHSAAIDEFNLKAKLKGKWKAKAFAGELHEEWKVDHDNWMLQYGYYIEQGDTTYRAKTKILKVEGQWILFSIIQDASPKIFKATSASNQSLTFTNSEYKNPFEVRYEFKDYNEYHRSIKGYEGDSVSTYRFEFNRIK